MNELDLFAAAIAIADQGERASLLDRECAGQPDLRQRIDKLLDAHFRSHPLLDQPVPKLTGAYASDEQPGAVMAGRYKLLEKIGEGGMGEVWVAEQTQPVRRKVALKLIKAGMDSKSVIARFEAERQALAVMDHPNVAKVFDGGLTETGRPYFVMEYVKGVPITEFCDATRLSVPERLQLFTQVCQAVQHAHQKGIIHRDLKPSNILVAPYDDKPVPKIIDFGLAKAMHQSLTEKTLHTAHESVLGTPLYMSPEQAQLNNLDVDTRSDIYSLGVLLYELLTGTTPLEKKRFKEAAWDEIRRVIREEEPPRPSTRLSSTATLPSLAACRQSEPLKLTKQVRGELDWIVMKALEKDRTRRYETANGFAMDVDRYLAGEAILAAPPSARYRLRKFARKHGGPLIAAGIFVALLAAGIVGTSIGLVQAKRAEWRANASADAARQAKDNEVAERRKAESAQELEKRALQEAENNFRRARRAVDTMFTQLAEKWLEHKSNLEPIQKQFLNEAARFYEDFARERSDDPEIRLESANANRRLGQIYHKLGESGRSEESFQRASAILEGLVGQAPAVAHYRAALIKANQEHGFMLIYSEMPNEALKAYRMAVTESERLIGDNPQNGPHLYLLAISHAGVGHAQLDLGSMIAAELAFRKALTLIDALPQELAAAPDCSFRVGLIWSELSWVLAGLGRIDEARSCWARCNAIYRKLVADFPADPKFRNELAWSFYEQAHWLRPTKPEDAEIALREGLTIEERLVSESPSVPDYKYVVGVLYLDLADILRNADRTHDAVAAEQNALSSFEKLLAEFPDSHRASVYLASSVQARIALAEMFQILGRTNEAAKVTGDGVLRAKQFLSHRLEKGAATSRTALRDLKSSAIAYRNMAILLTNGGQRKEAEEAFATSLCLLRRRAAEFPEIPGCLEDLAIGCNMLGCWLPGGEKDNQRTQLIRESIKIFENLAAEYPDNSSYPFVLADWNLGLAEILMSSNCQQQGEEAYRKSFKQFVTLPDQYLTPPERRAIVNRAFNGLSSLLKATGRTHEAQEITQQAIDLYKKLVKSQPIDLRLKQELAKYYVKLAVLLRASSKLEEAAQAFRAAREIYERDLAADFLVKNADANELYNAACVLALAADRRDETGGSLSREQCAQRAIAILQQAVANGWKDAEHMKKDDDLKALRGREDFRKLLAELEKTVERKDEADPKLPAEKK